MYQGALKTLGGFGGGSVPWRCRRSVLSLEREGRAFNRLLAAAVTGVNNWFGWGLGSNLVEHAHSLALGHQDSRMLLDWSFTAGWIFRLADAYTYERG